MEIEIGSIWLRIKYNEDTINDYTGALNDCLADYKVYDDYIEVIGNKSSLYHILYKLAGEYDITIN